MIRVTLPDGSVREVEPGSTPTDIAAAIGSRLARAALAAQVNGELSDLNQPIESDAELALITARDEASIRRNAEMTMPFTRFAPAISEQNPLRHAITAAYRSSETEALAPLIEAATLPNDVRTARACQAVAQAAYRQARQLAHAPVGLGPCRAATHR